MICAAAGLGEDHDRNRAGKTGQRDAQRGLPADDAVDHLLAKAAVGGGKPRRGKGGFKEILREFAAGSALR